LATVGIFHSITVGQSACQLFCWSVMLVILAIRPCWWAIAPVRSAQFEYASVQSDVCDSGNWCTTANATPMLGYIN